MIGFALVTDNPKSQGLTKTYLFFLLFKSAGEQLGLWSRHVFFHSRILKGRTTLLYYIGEQVMVAPCNNFF